MKDKSNQPNAINPRGLTQQSRSTLSTSGKKSSLVSPDMLNHSNRPSLIDSFKQKQEENNFFVKRSTSGLSQGK